MAEVRNRLWELLRLHYRYRFDPEGLRQGDRETLRREVSPPQRHHPLANLHLARSANAGAMWP